MKRLSWIMAVIGMIVGLTFNFAGAVDLSNVEVSGEISVVAKVQESYQTPLDWVNEREGANHRNSQHFRATGEIPAKTEEAANSNKVI